MSVRFPVRLVWGGGGTGEGTVVDGWIEARGSIIWKLNGSGTSHTGCETEEQ